MVSCERDGVKGHGLLRLDGFVTSLRLGWADGNVTELSYKVRANNVGKFVVPPIQAEHMYDRRVYARGPAGAALTVTAAPP